MSKKFAALKNPFNIFSIFVAFFIVLNIVVLTINLNNPKKNIENKWGISLPSHIHLKYKKNELGWFGEGERYFVFEIKNDDGSFGRELISNSLVIRKCADDIIFSMDIPQKYLPKWDNEYKGKIIGQSNNSHLCIIYFYTINELIICEEFI